MCALRDLKPGNFASVGKFVKKAMKLLDTDAKHDEYYWIEATKVLTTQLGPSDPSRINRCLKKKGIPQNGDDWYQFWKAIFPTVDQNPSHERLTQQNQSQKKEQPTACVWCWLGSASNGRKRKLYHPVDTCPSLQAFVADAHLSKRRKACTTMVG